MRIRHAIFLSCLLLAILPAFRMEDAGAWELITRRITAMGANLEKIEVEAHAELRTNDKICDIADNIYKKYGVERDVCTKETEKFVSIKSPEGVLLVKKTSGEGTYYISFTVSQYEHSGNINNIRDTISQAFSCYRLRPEISCLATFRFNRAMDQEEMGDCAVGLLRRAGIVMIKGIRNRNLVSYRGYSSEIENHIKMDDGNTNMNIGMRTVPKEGYTYLLVGSPIITVEY